MKKFGLFFVSLFVAGCSRDIDLKMLEDKTAESIFETGKKEIAAGRFDDAAQVFSELERLHPYSKLIPDAQIHEGECHYKQKKYDEAATAFDIFIKTHPTHKEVPYALYMLGMMQYEQMPIVERDQESTFKAIMHFNELVRQYPESKYSKQAVGMIDILIEQMAARELYVARYYQSRKNFAAAIGRLNTIIDKYTNTKYTPETLHRLVECYVTMGFFDEAKVLNKILQEKYKETEWAKYSATLLDGKK